MNLRYHHNKLNHQSPDRTRLFNFPQLLFVTMEIYGLVFTQLDIMIIALLPSRIIVDDVI